MGTGWLIVCEESGPHELPHKGKALLFAQYHLEVFARELELPPLKKFFSSDPTALAGYFRDQGLDPEQYELPDEEWFNPAEALPTVRALVDRLDEDPGPVQSLEKVRADLAMILNVLTEAEATGERFHIATAMPDLSGREPKSRQ